MMNGLNQSHRMFQEVVWYGITMELADYVLTIALGGFSPRSHVYRHASRSTSEHQSGMSAEGLLQQNSGWGSVRRRRI